MLDWTVILSTRLDGRHAGPRHPLDDPLERHEWKGLAWFVRLVLRSGRRRRKAGPPGDTGRGRR